MFNIRNWKQILVYMALGSVFTIIGMTFSLVTARRDTYETIQCSSLEVVDEDGEARVILSVDKHGGRVEIVGRVVKISGHGVEERKVVLGINEHASFVAALGEDGQSKAVLAFDYSGGYVRVEKDGKAGVRLAVDRHGGQVRAYGEKGNVAAELSGNGLQGTLVLMNNTKVGIEVMEGVPRFGGTPTVKLRGGQEGGPL